MSRCNVCYGLLRRSHGTHGTVHSIRLLRYFLFAICTLPCIQPVKAQQLPENIQVSSMHKHDFSNYDTADIKQLLKDSIHLQMSSSDDALSYFEAILMQSREISYDEGMASALFVMGQIYQNKGLNLSALHSMQLAANLFYKNELREQLCKTYNNIATLYMAIGHTPLSIHYYYLAAESALGISDSAFVSSIYYNLGNLLRYSRQGPYYLAKAESIARKHHNYEILGLTLLIKSQLMIEAKEYENAVSLLDESFLLAQKHKLPTILYQGYINYAYLALDRKDPEKAIYYLTKARKMQDSVQIHDWNKYYGMILWFRLMGSAQLYLGRYEESQSYLTRALEMAVWLNIKHQIWELHRLLSTAYEGSGDHVNALTHLRASLEVRDSVMNETIIRSVSDMEVKYRTAEKDQEIAIREAKIRERNLLIGGISAGSFLLLIGSFVYYRHLRQKQRLLRQQQEIEQLKALMAGEEKERNRIARELHDGIMVRFSSVKMNLGAIMKQLPPIPQSDALKDTITQLDNATQELRNSAHNLMPDMLLKDGLSNALRYFCNSMLPDTTTEITFQQYGTTPQLLPEYELMIYRIVQELVQNALKYAEATRIIVQLDHTDGLFTVTVEDNGKGFDTNTITPIPGSGLHSIRSRINAIGGTIEITSSSGKGTTIYIEMEIVNLQSDSL